MVLKSLWTEDSSVLENLCSAMTQWTCSQQGQTSSVEIPLLGLCRFKELGKLALSL